MSYDLATKKKNEKDKQRVSIEDRQKMEIFIPLSSSKFSFCF
jgi:hypothetical protein